MKIVDGSVGEGGGQIVRSALALSMLTGEAIRIDNIRAKRSKPGLMKQHLTAVMAAAELAEAEVNGAQLGSSRLVFMPRRQPNGGAYEFKIGTAGSTMLVLQTVLAPLMLAQEASRIVLEGGTHNPLAPPFDFVEKVYGPMLNRLGCQVEMTLIKPGFYPAGGGRCEVKVTPTSALKPLTLRDRGVLLEKRVTAIVAKLPRTIAERECNRCVNALDWTSANAEIVECNDTLSPGNVVFVELRFEHVTEVFSAQGERGKPAERVADEVVSQVKSYLSREAPVGEHLADQLILPLGIAAHRGFGSSCYHTGPLSDHTRTHIDLLRQLLDIQVRTTDIDSDTVEVELLR